MGEKATSYFGIPTLPSKGTLVPTSGIGADLFGAWAELIASTSAALFVTHVWAYYNYGSTDIEYVDVNIGVGTAASEVSIAKLKVALAQQSYYPNASGSICTGIIELDKPLAVATATRIAAQVGVDYAGSTYVSIGLVCANQSNATDDGIAESANLTQILGLAVGGATGTATAGGATSVTLAASTFDPTGWFIYIDSGTGKQSVGYCTAFNSGTKVATVNGWSGAAPANGSTYVIFKF